MTLYELLPEAASRLEEWEAFGNLWHGSARPEALLVAQGQASGSGWLA